MNAARSPASSKPLLSHGARRCSAGSRWWRSPPSAICGAAARGYRLWLRDEHHFSLQATGLLAAVPFLLSLGSKFLGGVLLDKMRPEQAPVLFIIGGLLTALSVLALMLSHQQAMLALFMLAANVFWGCRARRSLRSCSIMRRARRSAAPMALLMASAISAQRLSRC